MATMRGNGIAPGTLIAAIAVVIMAFGGGWTLMQAQFAHVADIIKSDDTSSKDRAAQLRGDLLSLGGELKGLVADIHSELRHDFVDQNEFKRIIEHIGTIQLRVQVLETLAQRNARDPIDKATVDAINEALSKRIDLIQAQITDINRQIAAALIIIDNNSAAKKITPTVP